jgi:hypothetical protein
VAAQLFDDLAGVFGVHAAEKLAQPAQISFDPLLRIA